MGKARKWNPPPLSVAQSKCFCCFFKLIMHNTLEVFWLFVV